MPSNHDDPFPEEVTVERSMPAERNLGLRLASVATTGLLGLLICYFAFQWVYCRIYVPEGHSLMLEYKGPLVMRFNLKYAPKDRLAEDGEIGVLKNLKGPGRYFYCPLWWKRTIVPDQIVLPGQVAICTSKVGANLPDGEFLVDGDLNATSHKGVLRKVFGPGRYRVHPRAYKFETVETVSREVGNQVKKAGWVEVPAGYVGVVTNLASDKEQGLSQGVQTKVLPPGLYPVNRFAQEIDIVEIGYRELSINVQKMTDQRGNLEYDESGEVLPVADTGINFPSNDGFKIHMDFTAIWGIMPDQAPQVVRTFGNVDAVEDKVIRPQSESICRNGGSKLGAVELLVGDTRQEFQNSTSDSFRSVLEDKGLTLLYGLVRHIYIPTEVRIPIQEGYIAEELKLTREQERDTARTEATLREEEQRVQLEAAKVDEETKRMVAAVEAEGQKEAEEIRAETERQVARIDRAIADLDAKRTIMLGEAEAVASKLSEEAKAAKFGLAVRAFGSPGAYTKWQFAEALPEDIELQLLYAGDGTLWTDLENVTPIVPLNERAKQAPAPKPNPAP